MALIIAHPILLSFHFRGKASLDTVGPSAVIKQDDAFSESSSEDEVDPMEMMRL